jgi:hypothetical protein
MQVFRLSLVLKALSEACKMCRTFPDANANSLTNEYDVAASRSMANLNPEMFVIEAAIVESAIKIVKCCSKTKLVLASYMFDVNMSFKEIVNIFFNQHFVKPRVGGIFLNYDEKLVKMMRKIMMIPESVVDTMVALKGNGTIDLVVDAMKRLQQQGLGITFREKNPKNNKMVNYFRKITHGDVAQNPAISILITNLGMVLSDFVALLLLTESRECSDSREQVRLDSKRKSSSSLDDPLPEKVLIVASEKSQGSQIALPSQRPSAQHEVQSDSITYSPLVTQQRSVSNETILLSDSSVNDDDSKILFLHHFLKFCKNLHSTQTLKLIRYCQYIKP